MAAKFLMRSVRQGAAQALCGKCERPFVAAAFIQVRTLYAPESLGLTNFASTCDRTKRQFGEMGDRFKTRMQTFLDTKDTKSMVFTEDLKNMLYLAQESDVDLVMGMVKRFHVQNKSLRFGGFIFGPVVMRLLHHLGRSDVALRALMDPELEGFFDQVSSFILCMDILYKDQHYEECLQVMDKLLDKQFENNKFPKSACNLALAACYKLNTPESWDYSSRILRNAQESGAELTRKAVCFNAGLGLKQKKLQEAAEVLAVSPQPNYVTVRNLKIMTLALLNRHEDALSVLNAIANADNPTGLSRTSVTKDCIEVLDDVFGKMNDQVLVSEYQRLRKGLQQIGQTFETTLDELLTSPIQQNMSAQQNRRNTGILAAGFGQQNHRDPQYQQKRYPRQRQRFVRPGLAEME